MTAEFSFKGLSDDRMLAIFDRKDQGGEQGKLQRRMIVDALEAATVEGPVPNVQVRRPVHDTEVPGRKLDAGTLELTFEWGGMYAAFFAEERRYGNRLSRWGRRHLRQAICEHGTDKWSDT